MWGSFVMLCAAVPGVKAADLPDGFSLAKQGDPFGARLDAVIDRTGRPAPALVLSFPRNTASEPGQFVAVSVPVTIPEEGLARLELSLADSFTGPTAGYHFALGLAGNRMLVERDVAGGGLGAEQLTFDLRAVGASGETTVTFRLEDRKAVSNFPVEVSFVAPRLITAAGARSLLPPPVIEAAEPLPADPPIPSLPIAGEEWTRSARILQPWNATQWEAVVNAAERAPWLAGEFGFNAVIMLPSDAHNAISKEDRRITDEEFRAALSAFRQAGFRIILYTSIHHCGHAPEWQEGRLAREHPEWSQRGPEGEPVTVYGNNWLCPSTGALDYTLEYTRGLVERYAPDGVMLDNNEFYWTPSGLTCYCASCQEAFRAYLKQRFGDTALGVEAAECEIPTEPGPLYNLWLHWRNRVWGQANERFRAGLRRTKPGLVVLANTQYMFSGPTLATDLQYVHEDAVLSESKGMSLHRMVAKLLLGQALSAGRPLWNYLGTFERGDFSRLVPPEKVSMDISTAFATGARPWIVYYGFTEEPDANREALRRMASTLWWHIENDHTAAGLQPYAPVLSLVSLASRNSRSDPLLPAHLTVLRGQGVPARLIEERALSRQALADARVLLIESASCLTTRAARTIADWVRQGGHLFAAPGAGAYDEIGRLRARPVLAEALGVGSIGPEPVAVGRGSAAALPELQQAEGLPDALIEHQFHVEPAADVEFLPYVTQSGDLLVYVCAESALPDDLRVSAPGGRKGTAVICSPDRDTPHTVPLAR
jgi:hypothetical protein